MQSPSRFETAAARAQHRLVGGAVAAAVVLGVLVALLTHPLVGLAVALVLGVGGVLLVRSLVLGAMDRVVSGLDARAVGPDDLASWHNALEGVALLTGVEVPEVRLLDSPAANALAAASPGTGRSAVVATSGFLEGAGPLELEVLAAELLCRVRDGSAAFATLAASMPSWLRTLAGLSDPQVAAVLGDQRATRADLDAVGVTRYPPGLVTALARMQERGTAVAVAPGTAALWVAPAVGPDGLDPAMDATANQSLGYRIAVLREI